MFTIEEYRASAKVLEDKLGSVMPEILIILGSGLGDLGEYVENPVIIEYRV